MRAASTGDPKGLTSDTRTRFDEEAEIYRDRTAPRATALLDRLSGMGACCCDCEMFLNAFALTHRPWMTSMSFGELIGTRFDSDEAAELREEMSGTIGP